MKRKKVLIIMLVSLFTLNFPVNAEFEQQSHESIFESQQQEVSDFEIQEKEKVLEQQYIDKAGHFDHDENQTAVNELETLSESAIIENQDLEEEAVWSTEEMITQDATNDLLDENIDPTSEETIDTGTNHGDKMPLEYDNDVERLIEKNEAASNYNSILKENNELSQDSDVEALGEISDAKSNDTIAIKVVSNWTELSKAYNDPNIKIIEINTEEIEYESRVPLEKRSQNIKIIATTKSKVKLPLGSAFLNNGLFPIEHGSKIDFIIENVDIQANTIQKMALFPDTVTLKNLELKSSKDYIELDNISIRVSIQEKLNLENAKLNGDFEVIKAQNIILSNFSNTKDGYFDTGRNNLNNSLGVPDSLTLKNMKLRTSLNNKNTNFMKTSNLSILETLELNHSKSMLSWFSVEKLNLHNATITLNQGNATIFDMLDYNPIVDHLIEEHNIVISSKNKINGNDSELIIDGSNISLYGKNGSYLEIEGKNKLLQSNGDVSFYGDESHVELVQTKNNDKFAVDLTGVGSQLKVGGKTNVSIIGNKGSYAAIGIKEKFKSTIPSNKTNVTVDGGSALKIHKKLGISNRIGSEGMIFYTEDRDTTKNFSEVAIYVGKAATFSIISDSGPALRSHNSSVLLSAQENATVVLHGNESNKSKTNIPAGIINAGKINFKFDKLSYLDIYNKTEEPIFGYAPNTKNSAKKADDLEIKLIISDMITKLNEEELFSEDILLTSNKQSINRYYRIESSINEQIEVYDEYVITANDIYFPKDMMEILFQASVNTNSLLVNDETKLIATSNAKLFNINSPETNLALNAKFVSYEKVDGVEKVLIRLSANENEEISIEVYAYFYEYDYVVEGNNILLLANNFSKYISEIGERLSSEDIIKYSSAKAYLKKENGYIVSNESDKDIKIDASPSGLETVGVYEVMLTASIIN